MNIRINGESRTIEQMSLHELLGTLDINPARVAVERNRDIVPKREYETTLLTDGDVIEIVQFVGGG
jgi:thiamine biosynthesis protein ThiS